MIRDRSVLDDERVPDRELVVHRRDELEELLAHYERAADLDSAHDVLVFGATGVGKTLLARLALRIRRELADAQTAYVNCWKKHRRASIVQSVGEQLKVAVHEDVDATDGVLERLREGAEHHRHVVLDEADVVEDPAVLRDLHECPDLQMILVGHDHESLFGTVPDAIESRMGSSMCLRLERYGADELADILEERADRALGPEAIDRSMLERIAASTDGDARTAISALRTAAEHAMQEERSGPGRRQIEERHVAKALPEAAEQIRQRSVSRLTRDQRILYELVCLYAPVTPGTLEQRYAERVDEPKSSRQLRSYRNKLEQYNLIYSQGRKRAKTYRPVGTPLIDRDDLAVHSETGN